MFSLSFKSNDDLQRAYGALTAMGISAQIPSAPSTALAGIARIEVQNIIAKKQKPYKERTYTVTIGPTTRAKAVVIIDALANAYSTTSANTFVVNDEIVMDNPAAPSVNIKFKVWYGARGNCPADPRGFIKRSISHIDTTAAIEVVDAV